jgi:FkbM family methyltransferase
LLGQGLNLINFSSVRPNTLLGKAVRYPFRILPHGIVMPILQGPLRGKKWIVGSHLHGCWLGSYELEVQKRLIKYLKRGDTFYDVGANVGFYSLLASVLTDPGRVYAFEPLPTNLDYFRRHLDLNRIRTVEVFEIAFADKIGTASFEIEGTRAMGRLRPSGGAKVLTSTLDALLSDQKIAPPDFIKMDIEGAELFALLGANECFARHRPKLLLATHGAEMHTECTLLLRSWHYEVHPLSGSSTDLLALPIDG